MRHVGVFAATRWELDAVRRSVQVTEDSRIAGVRCLVARRADCRVWLIRMGVGSEKSSALCRRVMAAQSFDAVVSAGFACALIPCRIGDLLIGTEVVSYDDQGAPPIQKPVLPSSKPLAEAAQSSAKRAGVPATAGRFVTVSRVVTRAQEKSRISATSSAIGLDMESAAVGQAASERQMPFIIVRAVSDLQDEDLPLDFNLFLSPSGWIRGAVSCIIRPSSLRRLGQLRAQCVVASEQITTFFGDFTDTICAKATRLGG